MKKGRPKNVWLILLAAVFLFSTGMIIRQQVQYHKIIEDSEEAIELAGLQSGPVVGHLAPSSEPLPEEVLALARVDLEALRAVNEEVAGWIEIPGTELSYPLIRGTDNRYYLTHNWKKESSVGGAVFLEATSTGDLTDFHTIVYAHRMNNDSMFGLLRHYKNLDFWQEHPCVYIVTEAGVYRYDIFAAQEASVKGLVYRLDLETNHLEEEFLQFCEENSAISTGITPKASDRILTLSTCTNRGHAKRWVVQAVLQNIWTIE